MSNLGSIKKIDFFPFEGMLNIYREIEMKEKQLSAKTSFYPILGYVIVIQSENVFHPTNFSSVLTRSVNAEWPLIYCSTQGTVRMSEEGAIRSVLTYMNIQYMVKHNMQK